MVGAAAGVLRRSIAAPGRVLAPAMAAALAAAVVAVARWGPDWPAQEFRAWSAAHYGLTAWTNLWYGGQALPGYSLIYPVIGGAVGAGWTGLLAVVAASVGAGRLAPDRGRAVAAGFDLSVVFVLGCDLVIGQLPYLLGVAFGVWAVWAARARHPWPAAVLAVAASVASPLAGVFVVLAVPALACALGWRRAAPLTGAVVGIGASAVLGGSGGPFPFEAWGLGCVVAFSVLAFVLTTHHDRPVRMLAGCYLLAAMLSFMLPNPVGGNLVRLGQLVALPVLWHVLPALRVRRRALLVPVLVLAAVWPAWPAASSIGRGAADPSRLPGYYASLLGFLSHQDRTAGRLEVVFTREHWEALWVAQAFPIARGWERQTDLAVNGVLYEPLTAASYRDWLDRNAVSLVALPDAPIDYGGRAEANLLRHPPAYLIPVWHDRNWQVWRVRDARPLVSGAARVDAFGPASFTLTFAHPGSAVVRIRASGMWTITSGAGCVRPTPGGWLEITATSATTITLRARVGLGELSASPRCR